MDRAVFLLILFTQSFLLCSIATAQQNYSANSILSCKNNDTTGPSPAFLYTCNGLHKSCQAFLIFKSQPPYNSTTTISNLTSSNPEELARINNVTLHTVFQTGKEVIIPVNCSCLTRDYYQAESEYVLPPNPTYFLVANDTYQGLSTCDSLMRANPYGVLDLLPGMELHVPLRCACPTAQQSTNGTKYLMTYSVNWGDNISNVAKRFNVTAGSVVDANSFSSENQALFPFTTVLIPFPSEPRSSLTIVDNRQPTTLPPLVSIAEKDKSKTKRKFIVAGATTGGFMLVLCVILSAVFLLRNRSAGFFKRGTKGKTLTPSEGIRGEIASIELLSKVYRFEEIKEATENFSPRNRIKGSVYRGVFGYGRNILAIKKINADASKEVNLLGKINHFNLIKLQGYCKNDGFFCLVFEYMENGSLREWLGKSRSTEHQCWAKRIQIALDIANGLQYLHNFTEPCYVHKDISTDNILLNGDLRAKIAKFTLAEESKREVTCGSSTLHVVGTRGYMAPEYLEAGIVTSKMDIYAFGVVLLELITGKDSIIVQDGREVMLSAVITNLIDEDDAEAKLSLFIDPRLTGNSGNVFALQLVRLSLACLIEEPARRPNMAEVVSSLLKIHTEMDRRISSGTNSSIRPER
ncbi:lysM domain receptor-like kinase 4 [Gastrolobium bilobum]|uniref:lysM domain receptor-like kinase 4 n=1 Tax=Gastrolobium bilobum TaxID=150636 RepID=UPI002AB1C668|nr:lysM domain receptor-like kinase 4 [Gastrolobium bilobum]